MKDQISEIILGCLRDVQSALNEPAADFSSQTVLSGPGADLDSMALLTLVVAVEESLNQRFGKRIVLTDERALLNGRNPFRTVDTLASYASALMQGQVHS